MVGHTWNKPLGCLMNDFFPRTFEEDVHGKADKETSDSCAATCLLSHMFNDKDRLILTQSSVINYAVAFISSWERILCRFHP